MFAPYFVAVLSLAAVLGLIPAYIAREKGHSFGLWWFYGWMLFIVALIHALSLPEQADPAARPSSVPYSPTAFQSAQEELEQYRRQRNAGEISQEKYQDIERQILGISRTRQLRNTANEQECAGQSISERSPKARD